MLKQIPLSALPKPPEDEPLNPMLRIPKSYFRPIAQEDISVMIKNEIRLQFAIRKLLSNEDQQFILSTPKNYNEIDIINHSLFHVLSQIFHTVRLRNSALGISGFFLKNVKESIPMIFQSLMERKEIDECLLELTNAQEPPYVFPIEPRAFEVFRESREDEEKEMQILLQNKFYAYLLQETSLHGGVFGISIKPWGRAEIAQNGYINQLTAYFEHVIVYGAGKKWHSEELILANPKNEFKLFSG